MDTPPIPTCETNRKFGLELEVHPVGQNKNIPAPPTGWVAKTDPSIPGGKEFVFAEPSTWAKSVKYVVELAEVLRTAKLNLSKKGSTHVHISAPEFTAVEGAALTNVYHHFKPAIDELVGPSRRAQNHFCLTLDEPVTPEFVQHRFSLGVEKTRLRARDCRQIPFDLATAPIIPGVSAVLMAQSAGHWMAVNLSYLGVPAVERSVEFRQGSASTRPICILGWMAFLCTLMDATISGPEWNTYKPDFSGLVKFVSKHGNPSIVTWLKWRREFMSTVEPAALAMVITAARTGPVGVFDAARIANASLPAIQQALERAVSQGQMVRVGQRYRSAYRLWAKEDLASLNQDLALLDPPPAVVVTAAPTAQQSAA